MTTPEWLTEDIAEALPEDYRDSDVLRNTKDVPSLAKQLVDSQKALGSSLRIPSKDAGSEDWDKFYSRVSEKVPGLMKVDTEDETAVRGVLKQLGLPEKPEDYTLKPDTLPDGVEWSDEIEGQWREKLHEIGVPAPMAKKIMATYAERIGEQAKAAQTAQQEKYDALKKEWGEAFDEKARAAKKAAEHYAGEDLAKAMDQLPAGVWVAMAKAADALEEKGNPINRGGPKMTPSEAQSRLDEIMNNFSHPYWNRESMTKAEKQRVDDEVLELQRLAEAGENG
ncbi:MAG: hypothetical protein GVY18_15690 [Bacteroidetes bacterium]|jgi:hypothetical protein|nr:hypothetical protein [Bacteroidota bacterium]